MAATRKSWAGTSLVDRRAARRAQLLEAGLELVASGGAAALSVRAACRESGLTERYFYESFADREALLIAVHDAVATSALAALGEAANAVAEAAGGDLAGLDAEQTEAMSAAIVHAFTSHLLDDPRRARVVARFPGVVDETDARLSGQAVVGALVHLYLGWLGGDLPIDRQRLERHAVAILGALGPLSSR